MWSTQTLPVSCIFLSRGITSLAGCWTLGISFHKGYRRHSILHLTFDVHVLVMGRSRFSSIESIENNQTENMTCAQAGIPHIVPRQAVLHGSPPLEDKFMWVSRIQSLGASGTRHSKGSRPYILVFLSFHHKLPAIPTSHSFSLPSPDSFNGGPRCDGLRGQGTVEI